MRHLFLILLALGDTLAKVLYRQATDQFFVDLKELAQ